ncbi:hypothetical protein SNE25_22065 [Mucilaginibacter sabulilitoris]|uniref:Phasin family protein n=1 Tax=Mucilaginibacter sabulilitoris TaxID=1173583 RepID=A0ABZ0TG68_9SPHI|nr:hypothetical protein [Mucilaginibacter sabulilitoris]WPU92008.1 hypothetical protein SNE25_22065 [Mucilaginibacter sabulilitoris]
MALDFKNILATLKSGVKDLAQSTLKDFIASATADGQAIIDSLQNDLERWTQQLANGEITKKDFEFLVLGQKDLIEMMALKQAGIAEIQAEKFKNGVFDLITNTVTGLVP